MNKRELTILAAKSINLPINISLRTNGLPLYTDNYGVALDNEPWWFNPIHNDDQAALLAREHKMTVNFATNNVYCGDIHVTDKTVNMAIVRAAALKEK